MKGSSEGWRKKEEVLVSVVPAALRPLLRGSPNGHTHTHSESNKGQQEQRVRERQREKEKVGVRFSNKSTYSHIHPFHLEEKLFCICKQNHIKG